MTRTYFPELALAYKVQKMSKSLGGIPKCTYGGCQLFCNPRIKVDGTGWDGMLKWQRCLAVGFASRYA